MKELLELEAKNAKSIEEEIEEERQKVDAKTPITETVCIFCPCIIFMHQKLQLSGGPDPPNPAEPLIEGARTPLIYPRPPINHASRHH